MENINEKIANLQLQISENCTEKEIAIIKAYWDLEKLNFVNMPKQIIEKFGLTISELTKLVASNSTLSLSILCENCSSYENHQVKSKTQFTTLIKKAKTNSRPIIKCTYCRQQEREQFNIEQEKKQKELIQKFENAIDNKNWINLSKFERDILVSCFKMNFKELTKHYVGHQLGKNQFIMFIKALENIASQKLLFLERDRRTNYIVGFQKLERLSNFSKEIAVQEDIKKSSVEIDSETDELKFKLVINKNQYHPDSPTHAGTFTLKERIVLEPDVEYIYGFWPRANENMYLTMTPLKNLDKFPVQKRISDYPISIQKGIQDFLKNLGKNF
jgi:hypothetical protein